MYFSVIQCRTLELLVALWLLPSDLFPASLPSDITEFTCQAYDRDSYLIDRLLDRPLHPLTKRTQPPRLSFVLALFTIHIIFTM